MKKCVVGSLFAAVLLLGQWFVPCLSHSAFANVDKVIIRLESTTSPPAISDSLEFNIASLDSIADELGIEKLISVSANPPSSAAEFPLTSRMYVGVFPDTADFEKICEDFEMHADVDTAVYDTTEIVFFDDIYFGNQWPLENTGQFAGADGESDIDVLAAWDFLNGSSSVRTAVLDSEFYLNHPDLSGQVDLAADFENLDSDPTNHLAQAHGTPIAAAIAGKDHTGVGAGVVGVAPGSKLLLGSMISPADWVMALNWAFDNGAKTVSLSVGFPVGDTPQVIEDLLVELAATNEILFCMAAGNNIRNETAFLKNSALNPRLISVGNTCPDGSRVPSSIYLSGVFADNKLTVCAPSGGRGSTPLFRTTKLRVFLSV